MARNATRRLSFLGVLALLVGVGAFVAPYVPACPVGTIPIALAGVGLAVLALVVSISGGRTGSGVPVLAIIVSAGALGLAGYHNGSFAGLFPGHAPAVPAPSTPTPSSVTPGRSAGQDSGGKSDNIFGIGGDNSHDTAVTPHPISPASPAAIHTPTPSISPRPTAPAISAPPAISLAEARAKLDAATAAVERALANDSAYVQAKAEVAAADVRRKAALEASGSGSPEVQAASQAWVDAKTKLRKLIDAAAAKSPSVQSAQHALTEAEAYLRRSK